MRKTTKWAKWVGKVNGMSGSCLPHHLRISKLAFTGFLVPLQVQKKKNVVGILDLRLPCPKPFDQPNCSPIGYTPSTERNQPSHVRKPRMAKTWMCLAEAKISSIFPYLWPFRAKEEAYMNDFCQKRARF